MEESIPARQDDPNELWKMLDEKDRRINDLRRELVKFQNYVEVARIVNTPSAGVNYEPNK